mmetsp:Transcript_8105/g.16916  ORF Transcript_8105/g.16916 Transcript_8105/m.16916 type:complete len:209 (+) Transcript_8105:1636-2262(+)
MKESLTTEHDCKLVSNTLPSFLDGGGVTNEDRRHLETDRRSVTDGRLEVVWNPFDKVGGVLVDHGEHLVVDFLTGHLTTEHHGACEVTSVTRISSAHHVLGVEGLIGEFRHRHSTEVVRASSRKRRKTDQEEMQTGERNHVHRKFAEIAVKLAGETQRASRSGDGVGNESIQITVTGVGKLERAEANFIKSFVIKSVTLISVLNKLVN